MADHMPTTPIAPAEVRGLSTPVSTSFEALLTSLAAFISAESDLEGLDALDPALANWRRDAEVAQDDVIDNLRAIREAAVQRVEDIPMQRLAKLFTAMMGSEEREEFIELHRAAFTQTHLFRCCGSSPAARRVDHMLVAALALLGELAMLELYEGSSSELDAGASAAA